MLASYEETIRYLYEALPMFQRIGGAALRFDLSNTKALCEALGNPQNDFATIHVGGTNGKGSTSHMLASVLQAGNYKTGLYTSPHLKSFTERIRINGIPVAESFVVDFVNQIRPLIESLKPSFFEITVVMAFAYFAHESVDVAVIEVGMGGRLDSTNVITPVLSVITNIGLDHQAFLGTTLQEIAGEKAGIIKQNIPVVIGERQPEVEAIFMRHCEAVGAPLVFADDRYAVQQHANTTDAHYDVYQGEKLLYRDLTLDLRGWYQRKNILGAVAAVNVLRSAGWELPETALRLGLAHVTTSTGLKGRWQVLAASPLMVCDTAHNASGMAEVVNQLKALPHKRLHIVFGMVRDKEIDDVLRLLPNDASYYFCQASIPRALEAGQLCDRALSYGLQGRVIPEVREAVAAARRSAEKDDVIFIGGSTFVVAEIEEL